MSEGPSLEVRDLVKHFPLSGGLLSRKKKVVRAVDGVSFDVRRGETLGVVGESGCGKSTLGKVVMKLLEPTSGTILLGGTDVTHLEPGAMWPHRRQIQLVFQDPYSSLNPRLSAGTIVGEPLENFGLARGSDKDGRVAELFKRVGLRPEAMRKYPHEFSGGQRQRLGIAKALAVNPDVIVADEPVSALDVSVQAQVLQLLADIRERFHLAMLFITHDLRVAAQVCDRIAVMRHGEVVEEGPTAEVFMRAEHPYTRELLAAVPGKSWTPPVLASVTETPA